jgi:hypothetical protein
MKKSHEYLMIASIITLIAICLIAMPFLFIGPPSPLFFIGNKDVNERGVAVEMFNSDNNSVFKEKYKLAPEEQIWQPKPAWLLSKLSFPLGDKEIYTVKVTSDDNLTETRLIKFELWNTVHVELYNHEAEKPIAINVTTV